MSSEWRKSSYSDAGQCVEWMHQNGATYVRDSKDPTGAVLCFDRGEWKAFLAAVQAGEADLLD